MNFVNEEDYPSLALGNFVHHAFQPFLKLALVFGTGYEGAHIQTEELLVAQIFGHVST